MTQTTKQLPKSLLLFLIYFIRPAWPLFLILFLAGCLWAVNQALVPFVVKFIVDHLTANAAIASISIFTWPILLGIGLWLLISLSGPSLIQLWSIPPFRARIRRQVLDYTYQHSQQYFINYQSGRIAQKISDLPRNAEIVIQAILFSFAPTLISFIFALFLLWNTGTVFGITLLLWGCLHLLTLALFYPWCQSLSAEYADRVSRLTGHIVDSVTNIMSVRLFARKRFELDKFSALQRTEIKTGRQALWANEVMKLIQALLAAMMVIAMLLLLHQGWQTDTVTLGDISLVTLVSINMMNLAWFIQFNLALFLREAGSIQSALSLLNIPHEITNIASAKSLKVTKGTIVFDRVNFSYEGDQHVFKGFTATLKGGEKVGLVGLSGAGKSTFINLILRLYDVQGGQITIDNQAINKVSQESIYDHITLIPQEVLLFNRSFMDNIRYSNLKADTTAVIAAAKKAQAHEFISKLPQGYDTQVGERGVKLSGGQRQRIAIARAILKDAPILMLDEATSALDSATEVCIQQAFQSIAKNRTTIVIAHRLSTLLMMDRILVFDKGQIIEDGVHQELLNNKGVYAQLWQLQNQGFLPE